MIRADCAVKQETPGSGVSSAPLHIQRGGASTADSGSSTSPKSDTQQASPRSMQQNMSIIDDTCRILSLVADRLGKLNEGKSFTYSDGTIVIPGSDKARQYAKIFFDLCISEENAYSVHDITTQTWRRISPQFSNDCTRLDKACARVKLLAEPLLYPEPFKSRKADDPASVGAPEDAAKQDKHHTSPTPLSQPTPQPKKTSLPARVLASIGSPRVAKAAVLTAGIAAVGYAVYSVLGSKTATQERSFDAPTKFSNGTFDPITQSSTMGMPFHKKCLVPNPAIEDPSIFPKTDFPPSCRLDEDPMTYRLFRLSKLKTTEYDNPAPQECSSKQALTTVQHPGPLATLDDTCPVPGFTPVGPFTSDPAKALTTTARPGPFVTLDDTCPAPAASATTARSMLALPDRPGAGVATDIADDTRPAPVHATAPVVGSRPQLPPLDHEFLFGRAPDAALAQRIAAGLQQGNSREALTVDDTCPVPGFTPVGPFTSDPAKALTTTARPSTLVTLDDTCPAPAASATTARSMLALPDRPEAGVATDIADDTRPAPGLVPTTVSRNASYDVCGLEGLAHPSVAATYVNASSPQQSTPLASLPTTHNPVSPSQPPAPRQQTKAHLTTVPPPDTCSSNEPRLSLPFVHLDRRNTSTGVDDGMCNRSEEPNWLRRATTGVNPIPRDAAIEMRAYNPHMSPEDAKDFYYRPDFAHNPNYDPALGRIIAPSKSSESMSIPVFTNAATPQQPTRFVAPPPNPAPPSAQPGTLVTLDDTRPAPAASATTARPMLALPDSPGAGVATGIADGTCPAPVHATAPVVSSRPQPPLLGHEFLFEPAPHAALPRHIAAGLQQDNSRRALAVAAPPSAPATLDDVCPAPATAAQPVLALPDRPQAGVATTLVDDTRPAVGLTAPDTLPQAVAESRLPGKKRLPHGGASDDDFLHPQQSLRWGSEPSCPKPVYRPPNTAICSKSAPQQQPHSTAQLVTPEMRAWLNAATTGDNPLPMAVARGMYTTNGGQLSPKEAQLQYHRVLTQVILPDTGPVVVQAAQTSGPTLPEPVAATDAKPTIIIAPNTNNGTVEPLHRPNSMNNTAPATPTGFNHSTECMPFPPDRSLSSGAALPSQDKPQSNTKPIIRLIPVPATPPNTAGVATAVLGAFMATSYVLAKAIHERCFGKKPAVPEPEIAPEPAPAARVERTSVSRGEWDALNRTQREKLQTGNNRTLQTIARNNNQDTVYGFLAREALENRRPDFR